MPHRLCQPAGVWLTGLLVALSPLLARAESAAGVAAPVATASREPLAIHGAFMAFITVLFVVVFAITIYSLAKHRKAVDDQPNKFAGPTGTVQWLWAMVPFAILLFVDYVLINIHSGG